MKTSTILIIAFLFYTSVFSQNLILNGSFEDNIASGNMTGLYETSWSGTVANSWAVDAGIMSLLSSGPCGVASDGNWFVSTCSNCYSFADYTAFTLKLSTPIIQGNQYWISFDKKNCGDSTNIFLGFTNDSNIIMGLGLINTFPGPSSSNWTKDSILFTANAGGLYILVDINPSGPSPSTVEVDNFVLTASTTGITEVDKTNHLNVYPNPANEKIFFQAEENLINARLEVFNIQGEKILNGSGYYGKENELNLGQMLPGVYFLKISDSHFLSTGLFVVGGNK